MYNWKKLYAVLVSKLIWIHPGETKDSLVAHSKLAEIITTLTDFVPSGIISVRKKRVKEDYPSFDEDDLQYEVSKALKI